MIQSAAIGGMPPMGIGQRGDDAHRTSAGVQVIARPSDEQADAPASRRSVVDRSTLEEALAQVHEHGRRAESYLKFEIDADLDRVIVKVVDEQSGEIIRQIPPEELLKIAKQLGEIQGLLIDRQT